MATKRISTGRRYGEEKPVQRNKETKNPAKPNRSPGESNANRYMPSLKEDTDKMFSKDVERIKKGASPTGRSALTRETQREAGKRAVGRMAGRGGYAGAALGAGMAVGDIIADKYIEKTAEGKVKLSDYAKRRLKEEEDFKAMEKAMQETQPEKKKSQTQEERFRARSREFTGMAAGGAVMTPKMQKKVGTVMKEYKAGTLRSGGTGKVVKNPKQAVAIAMSEARRIKK